MTISCPDSTPVTIELVHEALACLYSPTDLAKTPLAGVLRDSRDVGDLVQRAQIVRGVLLVLQRDMWW